jgi:VWFA-related protein
LAPAPAASAQSAGNPSSPPAPHRFVIFLFDDLHLNFEDLARAQKAAAKVLAETLDGSDMAAVASIGGANSGLTADRAKLEEAILKLKPSSLYRPTGQECPSISYYQANLIQNQHDASATEEAVQQVFSCNPGMDRQRDRSTAERIADSTAMQTQMLGRQDVQITLATIRHVVHAMASLPGQSTLVLVSPGFLTIEPDALTAESQIIDLAVHSYITISALDARGLYTVSGAASERAATNQQFQLDMKQSSARATENPMAEFAAGTGGTYFHNNNDLNAGFKRLTEAPECLYLLEFSLGEAKPDGRYHHLKVTTDRSGTQLQARRGYYAPKPQKDKK